LASYLNNYCQLLLYFIYKLFLIHKDMRKIAKIL
jgi:hypothetical protein